MKQPESEQQKEPDETNKTMGQRLAHSFFRYRRKILATGDPPDPGHLRELVCANLETALGVRRVYRNSDDTAPPDAHFYEHIRFGGGTPYWLVEGKAEHYLFPAPKLRAPWFEESFSKAFLQDGPLPLEGSSIFVEPARLMRGIHSDGSACYSVEQPGWIGRDSARPLPQPVGQASSTPSDEATRPSQLKEALPATEPPADSPDHATGTTGGGTFSVASPPTDSAVNSSGTTVAILGSSSQRAAGGGDWETIDPGSRAIANKMAVVFKQFCTEGPHPSTTPSDFQQWLNNPARLITEDEQYAVTSVFSVPVPSSPAPSASSDERDARRFLQRAVTSEEAELWLVTCTGLPTLLHVVFPAVHTWTTFARGFEEAFDPAKSEQDAGMIAVTRGEPDAEMIAMTRDELRRVEWPDGRLHPRTFLELRPALAFGIAPRWELIAPGVILPGFGLNRREPDDWNETTEQILGKIGQAFCEFCQEGSFAETHPHLHKLFSLVRRVMAPVIAVRAPENQLRERKQRRAYEKLLRRAFDPDSSRRLPSPITVRPIVANGGQLFRDVGTDETAQYWCVELGPLADRRYLLPAPALDTPGFMDLAPETFNLIGGQRYRRALKKARAGILEPYPSVARGSKLVVRGHLGFREFGPTTRSRDETYERLL